MKNEDDDGYVYKKYNANDVKVIKAATSEKIDEEEMEHKKELEELERLGEQDREEEQKDEKI